MPSLANIFVIVNPHRRRGTALLVTMLVTTAVVAILFVASDRTHAASILADLESDRLRASLAAESVAALIEAKLVGHAAEVENLTTNVEEDPATWWNLAGCAYLDGTTSVIPQRGLWVNGCLVRWRIEPVKIASVVEANTTANNATFTVNRQINPNHVAQRDADARSSSGGATLLPGNPPYFHYRIVTEAYALKNQDDVTVIPWSETGRHTVSAQVQRVIQLNHINLFDYAIFYGASGETGDLEFEPDQDVTMFASMHSNGAIYLGGAGESFKNKDYKKSASDGGVIVLGNRTDKVEVLGVMGVVRLRKAANVFFASPAGNDEPSIKAPLEVPLPGKKVKKTKNQSAMSGLLDLNGGDGNTATEKVAINGEKFTYRRDSRSDWSLPENRVDPYIKDAKSGGGAITHLASIPQFSGYPLEAQRMVGEQIPLYRTVVGDRYTVNPGREPASALFYSSTGQPTTNRVSASRPVYATDMPLFRLIDGGGKTYEDVWPNQPDNPQSATLLPSGALPALNAPTGTTTPNRQHTWLPVVAARGAQGALAGYYLEQSLFGQDDGLTTGLTIRERGRQNPAFGTNPDGTAITGFAIADVPPVRAPFSNHSDFVTAYVAWLQAHYAVYLGLDGFGQPRDITEDFFSYAMANAVANGDLTKLVASQDRFVNRREAQWLQAQGYLDVASARTLRARPLTLHMAQVCAFLRTAHPSFAGKPPAANFNGLIYIHRTPRLGQVVGSVGTYEPLAPLRYNPVSDRSPFAPSMITNTVHPFMVLGSLMPGTTPEVGSPGTWVVYPLHLPVRIDQAEKIDLGVRPAGNPGLTIITPDPCYIRGSFNITPAADGKLPPCALFADSLTALSTRWSDADNDQDDDYSGALPTAGDSELNLSLVLNNLPTDEENVVDGGSGGVHSLIRYLEDWTNKKVQLRGSVVVLNRMRYSRAPLGENISYRTPQRIFIPDPGAFSGAGKPPFAPVGIKVTRMVSTLAEATP